MKIQTKLETKCPIKLNLSSKQDFLLPKALKTV